ncbi:hypothetical protein [Myroides odoratimimus]|uniref:hypothetical protein n=1 Tax=Myroides odoratimimus TaxID=76832 RepID=UPI001CE1694D|nr:hypothetical protein [Myroides odoratimimus]MCA4806401.1 hypothetical protein [Myroides odoratimimus]MDM1083689.1 hypothetical protein [Myroides odoratimimus]
MISKRYFTLRKIALYKFLGKFIPYFKNKIMVNNTRICDLLTQKIQILLMGDVNNTLKIEITSIIKEVNDSLLIRVYFANYHKRSIFINFNVDVVDYTLKSYTIDWSNYIMDSDLKIHEQFNTELMYLAKELSNIDKISKI